jgi:hypothetical protein
MVGSESWLWLGHLDPDSNLAYLPKEVIFHFCTSCAIHLNDEFARQIPTQIQKVLNIIFSGHLVTFVLICWMITLLLSSLDSLDSFPPFLVPLNSYP